MKQLFLVIVTPFLRMQAQKQLLFGKRQRALKLFSLLYKWNPNPENQFSLALCKMNLREYQAAIDLIKPIYDKLPDQQFAGITYAQCLMLARQFYDAEAVYHRLLEFSPQNQLLTMLTNLAADPVGRDKYVTSLDFQYQASLLQDEKKYPEALGKLNQALSLTPDDAALHNNIGALKQQLKHPVNEVMASFAKAMELNPQNERYRRNYRAVWQKNKK